jgi:hypothetical protein
MLSWSLWIANVLSHCTPIFYRIWQVQKIWSVVDRNPHRWSPIISSVYELNLERRILDGFLYMKLIAVTSHDNYCSQFNGSSFKLVKWWDSFHWSGTPPLFQMELMRLWISDHNVLPHAWMSSAGIWSLPSDWYVFDFAIAISTSMGWVQALAAPLYFHLPNTTEAIRIQ